MTESEKAIRENIAEPGAVYFGAIKDLIDEIDSLRQSVNDWKGVVKLVSNERDQAQLEAASVFEERADLITQLNQALDALTVTREEWLLRVKFLEKELYDARK
jgi:hypothetical protein